MIIQTVPAVCLYGADPISILRFAVFFENLFLDCFTSARYRIANRCLRPHHVCRLLVAFTAFTKHRYILAAAFSAHSGRARHFKTSPFGGGVPKGRRGRESNADQFRIALFVLSGAARQIPSGRNRKAKKQRRFLHRCFFQARRPFFRLFTRTPFRRRRTPLPRLLPLLPCPRRSRLPGSPGSRSRTR